MHKLATSRIAAIKCSIKGFVNKEITQVSEKLIINVAPSHLSNRVDRRTGRTSWTRFHARGLFIKLVKRDGSSASRGYKSHVVRRSPTLTFAPMPRCSPTRAVSIGLSQSSVRLTNSPSGGFAFSKQPDYFQMSSVS